MDGKIQLSTQEKSKRIYQTAKKKRNHQGEGGFSAKRGGREW